MLEQGSLDATPLGAFVKYLKDLPVGRRGEGKSARRSRRCGDRAIAKHAMEFRDLLLGLVLVWLAAKVAGEAMERIGQTAVLGELLAGVIIGPGVLGLVHESEALHALAELGVLILLFEVGLESDLGDLLRAGASGHAGRPGRRGGAVRGRLRRHARARAPRRSWPSSSAPRSPRPASASRPACSPTSVVFRMPPRRWCSGRPSWTTSWA